MNLECSHVYHFEVSLHEVEAPVWRATHVPSDYSFWDRHVAIQDAMGLDWQNREFRITAITRQHLTGVESALQY